MTRRMVIAPHADDESLGCGGVMAKHPDDDWAVLLVTEPDSARLREFTRAMEELGVSLAPKCLCLSDGGACHEPRYIVTELDKLVSEFRPAELYLPWPGTHQDHVATYEAGMRAARLSMRSAHWYAPRVLVYDIAVYDLELYRTDLRWNVFEQLTEEQADRKARAVACYQSQVDDAPYFSTGQEVYDAARALGAQHGVGWAERFALVREVR